MPKVKAVTAMKERLQEEALSNLAEQEEMIDLVKEFIEKYGLGPGDSFSEDALGSAMEPDPVDPSIRYCDRPGNVWSGNDAVGVEPGSNPMVNPLRLSRDISVREAAL